MYQEMTLALDFFKATGNNNACFLETNWERLGNEFNGKIFGVLSYVK
jgi:hypothetical protein